MIMRFVSFVGASVSIPGRFCAALRAGSAVILVCFAAGCAGIGPTLKPEVVAIVNSTTARGFLPQAEVKAEYLQSGYGAGGGLIGAIVDAAVTSGRRSGAEKRVQVLREQVKDVDFRGLYWQTISNTVMGVPWLKGEQLELVHGTTLPRVTKQMVKQRAVLNIGADYYISQDCRALVVATGLGFFPPGKAGTPRAANIVAYHSPEVGKPDGEQAIALWSTDGAASFRKAALEAIQENGKLVRYALEYMGGATAPSGPLVTLDARLLHAIGDYGIKAGRVSMKGTILEQSPDRLIFRSKAGRIFSLPRAEVEIR